MGYALAENLSFCVRDEAALLLDLARDIYIGLSPRLTQVLLSLGGDAADSADAGDVGALIARGIIHTGSDCVIEPCRPPRPPAASLFGVDQSSACATDTFAAFTSLLLCATRLRLYGILSIVTRLRAAKALAMQGELIGVDNEISAIVAAFRATSHLISREGNCLI